jgi:hypothetical protein
MNANELPAEQLAQWCDEASQEYGNKPLVQVATMLRQQQAELNEAGHIIGVLREYISDLENGLDSSIKLNKAQALRKAQEK